MSLVLSDFLDAVGDAGLLPGWLRDNGPFFAVFGAFAIYLVKPRSGDRLRDRRIFVLLDFVWARRRWPGWLPRRKYPLRHHIFRQRVTPPFTERNFSLVATAAFVAVTASDLFVRMSSGRGQSFDWIIHSCPVLGFAGAFLVSVPANRFVISHLTFCLLFFAGVTELLASTQALSAANGSTLRNELSFVAVAIVSLLTRQLLILCRSRHLALWLYLLTVGAFGEIQIWRLDGASSDPSLASQSPLFLAAGVVVFSFLLGLLIALGRVASRRIGRAWQRAAAGWTRDKAPKRSGLMPSLVDAVHGRGSYRAMSEGAERFARSYTSHVVSRLEQWSGPYNSAEVRQLDRPEIAIDVRSAIAAPPASEMQPD